MSVPRKLLGVPRLLSKSSATGEVESATIEDKNILLYFSAQWCPPCRAFTPELIKFHEKHAEKHNFEIVFCSWDQTEEEFMDYYQNHHGKWLAMPFQHRPQVDAMAQRFGVQTIPTLILIGANGDVVCKGARNMVASDPEAKQFPWTNTDKEMSPLRFHGKL